MEKLKISPSLHTLEAACRKAGIKVTHQRIEVYFELAKATDHPSAEMLHQRLRRRIHTISLDTVYRTLALFCHNGIAQRVDTNESQARFEAVIKRHHHLICCICKKIMDFEWPGIDRMALPPSIQGWGEVETRNLVAYGTCRQCLGHSARLHRD